MVMGETMVWSHGAQVGMAVHGQIVATIVVGTLWHHGLEVTEGRWWHREWVVIGEETWLHRE